MRELSRAPDMLTEVHLPENPLSPAFEQWELKLRERFHFFSLGKLFRIYLGTQSWKCS